METYTEKEIRGQFGALRKILSKKQNLTKEVKEIRVEDYDGVIFVGCGSSYYISLIALSFFRELFSNCSEAIPGGEILLSPETHLKEDKKYLVFLISRSGESTETVRAGEFLKKNYDTTLVSLTTEPDSSLVKIGDISIILDDAREKSVVMTQSFTVMVAFFLALFRGWKNIEIFDEEMVDKAEKFYKTTRDKIKSLLSDRDFDHFVFLGQGYAYGLAQEGALKVKEMSIGFSEGFHSLEYRHGPKSIITDKSLIFIFPLFYDEEKRLAEELEDLGGKVLFLGEEWGILDDIDKNYRFLFWIPIFHEFGLQRALYRGLNPDNPKNLTKVVKLD
ncbi:MAG TPA: SIS domain-containing protein [Candidatus Atribacteria bacterium]|nr:SIS domain-containing protein [Candidatus Atribacteria bacterium]